MYVANFGSDTVSVIDSSNTVVASISVGSAPESMIFDSAKGNKEIYVANFGGDTVETINSTSNSVIGSIVTGSNLHFLTYNPANQQVYSQNSGNDTVSAISGNS
jgi:YVTN family beta-propeller protein